MLAGIFCHLWKELTSSVLFPVLVLSYANWLGVLVHMYRTHETGGVQCLHWQRRH